MRNGFMRVSEYYNSACKTKAAFNALVSKKTRYSVLNEALRGVCNRLVHGTSVENILDGMRDFLDFEYNMDMFSFVWQRDQAVIDDVRCMRRFLEWVGNVRFLAANRAVEVKTKQFPLSCNVSLITKDNKYTYAYIIHWKKADKSLKGKDVHTATNTDLYALTTKLALEDSFPGIKVRLVYLTNDGDSPGNISTFKATDTRKSNVFTLSYEQFYDEGVFDRSGALQLLEGVLKVPLPASKCFACECSSLCSESTLLNMSRANSRIMTAEQISYVMPEFSPTQKRVIQHKDGPMLVGAGPGSGKTATLVGRIQNLIAQGVEPEFILAITFTRDAAGELLNRCKSFCKQDEKPDIMTLNALGYYLLTHNELYVGKKVQLLSQMEKLKIIEGLISISPPIKGFSYGVISGKNGLLMTMARRLEEYSKGESDAYLAKNGLGDDFVSFYRTYKGILDTRGYINYDEQITLAQDMLDAHPEVAKALSARYKYIMVDEYQDINAEQAKFIYTLASHGNLVAVGDDDQSIYGFRGGSNKYMLEFTSRFPGAESVILKENFRSTEILVEAAQARINKNRHRLQKQVIATRKGGVKPISVEGKGPEALNKAVDENLSEGYKYSDIAVLASKNATLEELSREVSFPKVLGKSYLIEDVVFRIIFDILSLYYNGKDEDLHLMHLFLAFGLSVPQKTDKPLKELLATLPEYSSLSEFIKLCNSKIQLGCSAAYLLDLIFDYTKTSQTASQMAFEELLEQYHVNSCDALYELMDYMVRFEDDTRIEPDTSESVLFITSHESKGMEWPVVLMVDDYKDDGSEEVNRLYYVAMTRAKDRLYVFSSKTQKANVA